MTEKYKLPDFLESILEPSIYKRWLHRKALSILNRDRKRGNKSATNKEYKLAIHEAVIRSKGLDEYTEELLEWSLISTWDNQTAKEKGREYRMKLRLLPSVDHVDDGTGTANFKICGLMTNDIKSCMTYDELIDFCKLMIKVDSRRIKPQQFNSPNRQETDPASR